MEIKIMSRNRLTKYSQSPHSEKSAVISITDIGREPVNIACDVANGISVIHCEEFDDEDERKFAERDGICNPRAISYAQADAIADFVFGLSDTYSILIVQCEAGISRSAGCAAAISKCLYGEDAYIFDNKLYCPNMTVYRRVLNALNTKKESRN